MENGIVSGLFGLSAFDVQKRQNEANQQYAASLAQADPFVAAKMSLGQAGAGLGQIIGTGMLGMVNPEEVEASNRQRALSQVDFNTPEGILNAAKAAGERGDTKMSLQLQMLARQRMAEQQEAELKTAKMAQALAETEKAQRPTQEGGAAPTVAKLLAERSKYAPNSQEYKVLSDAIRKETYIKSEGGGVGAGQKLTKGQEAADREFGKEYAQYQAGGGSADIEKQLRQLEQVSVELGKPGNDYTGSAVGLIPAKVRAITNPEAVAAQNKVEEVAQRNLRLVLGAQFTQTEGERLIARAYNPQMPPAENKARVDALINQIRTAAQVKEDAAKYFEENGTLAGWKGRMPTLSDFESVIESAKPSPASKGGVKTWNSKTGQWEMK